MSVDLDPREVLMHLHEMGYYNITNQQLEEFIKDLKRLIKFDTTKKKIVGQTDRSEDTTSSTLPNTTDESLPCSPPPRAERRHRSRCRSSKSKETELTTQSSSESSVAPSRPVLRECTKISAQQTHERDNIQRPESSKLHAKPSKSCDCLWRRIGCKCCDENYAKEQNSIKTKSKENLAPPRPKSSFIRTWQLAGQSRPGSAPQRCDPVALYQQYQQVWKQQKLPGETNHNQLRWTIRERMLGQDPHPRPMSQASSSTSVSRGRKRI